MKTVSGLSVPNVLLGRVDWISLKLTSLAGDDRKNLSLECSEILFMRVNDSSEYIGRCAVFEEHRQAEYAFYLIRIRLKDDSAVDPEYISGRLALPTMR